MREFKERSFFEKIEKIAKDMKVIQENTNFTKVHLPLYSSQISLRMLQSIQYCQKFEENNKKLFEIEIIQINDIRMVYDSLSSNLFLKFLDFSDFISQISQYKKC